jgi:chromosome segregation ATPase
VKKICVAFFTILLMVSCASTRVVPPPIESAREYRDIQEELHQQQTEIAITGQKVENQSRGLVNDLTRLEEVIAAAPDAGEAGHLVQAARVKAENHAAEIENLNRQLAVERETVKKKDRKFNDYESKMIGELSSKDTENAKLREEVKTVKGQRNTLLAILITAAIVVVLFVTVKVLRVLKIIPF